MIIGCFGGAAIVLCSLNSEMISVHCIYYRLALARGQALNEVKYLREDLLALRKFSTVQAANPKHVLSIM